jgi:1-acyl-sn-glycerol-3-phosphate acyltransferase
MCNAVVAVYIYSLVPEFMLRFVAWLLIHSVYRLQQKGWRTSRKEGAAVLVCNHVSFVDPIVIAARAGDRSAS